MSNKNVGKFLAGAAIGTGLGIVLAPKSGKETRKELKEKIHNLIDQVKHLDKDKLRSNLEKKIEKLEIDLNDLNKEKVLKNAKKKAEELNNKAKELVEFASKKGSDALKDAAEAVRLKTIEVTKDVLNKLEKEEK
ncbi:MAG: YtxH domain-containing protein [bacterium]|nr:YtxH domain-containing protein [bacterium]